jgi:TM2 domain-containing membrane protein YozV
MIYRPKSRKLAIILALVGVIAPVSGLHKFYLRQPGWGIAYLLLSRTPISRIASIIEGIWYLVQDDAEFDRIFNSTDGCATPATTEPPVNPEYIGAIADSLRHLDDLRKDGLISEYEFEQKRRQLLDRIA